MRVIFMGTPDFAVPTLQALVDAGHEIVLVVTRPDQPAGRGKKLRSPPVAVRARELGLPLAQPRAIKRGPFPERMKAVEADVGVVLAYGRILTETLLDTPRLGCINIHASLLPRWRGAAPIQAAILAGDSQTGVCTQQMEPDLDTGPVFDSATTPIHPHDTAGSLHDRLMTLSTQVAVTTLSRLEGATPTPQQGEITWAPKIEKSDGCIRLDGPAADLERRVRAMSPWPGGFVETPSGILKLKEVGLTTGKGAPGQILATNPLTVACGSGALELRTVQAAGRRAVSGVDFANGARLSVGSSLL